MAKKPNLSLKKSYKRPLVELMYFNQGVDWQKRDRGWFNKPARRLHEGEREAHSYGERVHILLSIPVNTSGEGEGKCRSC